MYITTYIQRMLRTIVHVYMYRCYMFKMYTDSQDIDTCTFVLECTLDDTLREEVTRRENCTVLGEFSILHFLYLRWIMTVVESQVPGIRILFVLLLETTAHR